MKRFISLFLAFSFMSTSVFAAEISVILDGAEVEFSAQEPVIAEGRTLIPLRGVFEQLGYEISWDGTTKTAAFTNSDSTIAVTADSSVFIMNGEEIALDVPASIINGSMMLPLRAVGEAAGLEVEWDSAEKTVILKSSGEDKAGTDTAAQTEETAEETTEEQAEAAVTEDDIPAEDLEALQVCANSTSTIYSLQVLNNLLGGTLEYAYYKIDGALEYSYSTAELSGIFEDSITECEGYKAAAKNLKTTSADETLVKRFIAYADKQTELLQFYYDYYCTDNFADLTNLGIKTKVDNIHREMDECIDSYNSASEILIASVNKTAGVEKYNGWQNNSLTAAQKTEIEKYHKEIGDFVSAELDKVVSTDALYVTGSAFVTAASNIKNKINSTETPELCMLDKQCMLRACELISQAGTAIKNGAYTKDGKNQYYIEYLAVILSCDFLFSDSLGDYFNLSEGDFDEAYNEVGEDPDIESILV